MTKQRAARPGRSRTLAALPLLAMMAAVGCAGCGSSGSSTGSASAAAREARQQNEQSESAHSQTSGTSTSAPTTSTPPNATTLPEIGSYTVVARNTKVVAEIRLGSLQYGQAAAPPAEALEACPGASEGVGTAAFAQGEVVFTYSEGSVPFAVSLNGKGSMAGVGVSNLALHSSAGWTCSGEEIVQYTLQPNQTTALPFWVVNTEALTNARPRLSQAELNQVSVNLTPFGAWEHEEGVSIEVSGPQVVTCPGEPENLRYKVLPYAQLSKSGACHEGGGRFKPEG